MVTTKYLLSTLAVLRLAAGQSSLCSQPTATIKSQADASALASCTTVGGAVAIASTVSNSISLDGIQEIEGDLICVDAVNLGGLSANDLTTIGGSMTLTSLTILSNLAFPQLTSVGSLQWSHLNALQELGFTTGVSQASSVLISDTQLNKLDGIDLSTVESIDINNNPYLQVINTQIGSITKSLNIDSNGQNLAVQFPNLTFTYNMTLRNIKSVSIPSLESVNKTLGFYESLMTDIFAPKLTSIGGEVAFVANPSLVNISMPLLKTVSGGFTIANNTVLSTIDGFPSLKTTGAITISGKLSSVALPALGDCQGTFNLESSADVSCSAFDAYSKSKVIKGLYNCTTPTSSTVEPGSSGTGTGTSSSPSASSTNNAVSAFVANVPTIAGLTTMVAAFTQMIL